MTKHDKEPRGDLTDPGWVDLAELHRELEYIARRARYPSPTGYIELPEWGAGEPPPEEGWHEIVTRDFACQLMDDAHRQGGELVEWLSASAFEFRFVLQGGPPVRIAPDSAIRLDFDGVQHWSLLECEEDRVDAGELRAKLARYRRYYDSEEWRQQFPSEPTLLFVCVTSQAERQVLRALSRMPAGIPAFVTAEERYRHSESTSLGTTGRIWRVPRTADFGWAFPQIGG